MAWKEGTWVGTEKAQEGRDLHHYSKGAGCAEKSFAGKSIGG